MRYTEYRSRDHNTELLVCSDETATLAKVRAEGWTVSPAERKADECDSKTDKFLMHPDYKNSVRIKNAP